MRPEDFGPNASGDIVPVTFTEFHPVSRQPRSVQTYAFLPNQLPVSLELSPELSMQIESAVQALGRLDGLGSLLRNPYLLIRQFLRREAVASSRIEGTVTSLRDLAVYEDSDEPPPLADDFQEVLNYVRALERGLQMLPDRDISATFIRELHTVLMSGVRGQDKHPGSYRQTHVYIGHDGTGVSGARFVPPPAFDLPALMHDLERVMITPPVMPRLVMVALIHYQFETIHPFEDGNGRVGRLIISLLLQQWGLLDRPMLYLSDYFERERRSYVDGLLAVSQQGAWSEWVSFFLEAVRFQANDAVQRAQQLLGLREDYRHRYQERGLLRALAVIDRLFEAPSISVRQLADQLGVHYSTAQSVVNTLEQDGILQEVTGRKRNRRYLATGILDVLAAPAPR